MSTRDTKTLVLFDIDGTLTPARQAATDEMKRVLQKLREKVVVGIVGGSDLAKGKEQLGDDLVDRFDYYFPENGLVAFKDGKQFHAQSFKDHLGEEKLKEVINFVLHYIADLEIPQKRGTFVEFRTGMLNISPVGRNCSQEERIAFNEYDKIHKVREKMVAAMQERFAGWNLRFSIGGQISFDLFPVGWDKTYCLNHLKKENFETIHFFGDKTNPGENDHEIYVSEDTVGHVVTSPDDTLKLLNEMFGVC
eukprot:CAMPEP_0177685420 /NCGR_PEP_ID=MMETSP0447-20121125/33029_1 /TAXON_ID=0 /ORGANISM="Stygamoeba regulata, Strain BSH-02190019" /LENGTH=249 /DNA_ID=CAMNT_0019195481 /DNA_START=46 /DNA_END=795 /DNA_ORIENTATION=-